MRTADLDFDLPDDCIATAPAQPRDAARLMVIDRATGRVQHRRVRDLPTLGVFAPGDLMVVNQTRVLPAYLTGTRAATGGKITGLFVQADGRDQSWHVMLESRGKLQPGEAVDLTGPTDTKPGAQLKLVESLGRGQWKAEVHADGPTDPPTLLGRIGQTPLPPYIRKARRAREQPVNQAEDADRYNTVYAADHAEANLPGAGGVAAATAGLHFTEPLLAAMEAAGVQRVAVTLRVGLGTFLPVQTEVIEDHPIHDEWIDVTPEVTAALREARANERSVWAVGTTTVRTLESLPEPIDGVERYTAETGLFITPDAVAEGRFAFRFTDRLMTNFHLPRSTLLAMVAALPGVGVDRLLGWYREAIDEGYRFYSYGDAMLIV
ncbi:MAG: tRNA preQ1(34) S-adenosylmethionine ribosyltransferase-isomerase QueA [Planctomycetota bacterium]